jgi:hypothetical protein
MIRKMPFKLPLILSIVVAVFKDRADLVAENAALPAGGAISLGLRST